MVVLAVERVGGVAEFGDLGAAFGVYGQRGWGDCMRGFKGYLEGAVEGVEGLEFGVNLGG